MQKPLKKLYFYKKSIELNNLLIYKASAGSGKTYTLVRNFIHLLFENPQNYKHILAVTFTNKATAEMKSKVVEELFLLSKTDTHQQKSDYRNYIKQEFPHFSDAKIQETALKVLGSILNNYSHFFISTIDKFFQYIIKSFSRELGIYNNYSVQLDTDTILNEAVEALFLNLEDDSSSNLLKWLTNYAEERVEQGEKYDITSEIVALGKELFKEQFKSEKNELFLLLEDKSKMFAISKDLRKGIKDLEEQFADYGRKGLEMIENFGLTTADFKQGQRSGMNLFNKLVSGKIDSGLISSYTLKMVENDDEWTTEKSPYKDLVVQARENGLKDLLLTYMDFHEKNYELLQSLIAVNKNLYTLGIFLDLQEAIKTYTKEHNLLLLSDSNELIASIIGENDTPFIYEKVGNKFNHFMIDEFQDTSDLQWQNFKPLFYNSLSMGFKNLLVGDVKQSIYRWRNSDWQLLAEKIYSDFSTDQLANITLTENWRSSKQVVEFNNFIFDTAPFLLQTKFNSEYERASKNQQSMIANAYSEQKQNVVHTNKQGYVHFKNFGKSADFDEQEVFNEVIAQIEDAQERQYKAGDICILVRTNKEGTNFINFLLNYKLSDSAKPNVCYDVVSSDSLMLGGADIITFIINVLRLETELNNPLLISEINYFYASRNNLINNQLNTTKHAVIELFQPIQALLPHLRTLSLKEKTDYIINTFELERDSNQVIFIETFRDLVNDFILHNASDILGFLTAWENGGKKTKVQPPKTDSAIQVMTIHKAKGLEFPIVILPFMNWNMALDGKGRIAWCKVPEKLNLPLPLVPVKLNKQLADTVFKNTLLEEELLSYVDNLNMLYVALTRAKTELYMFGSTGKNNATELIELCIERGKEALEFEENTETSSISFGSKIIVPNDGKLLDENAENILHLKGKTKQELKGLSIKTKAPAVFSPMAVDVMKKAHVGTILHDIFKRSKNLNNIIALIKSHINEGMLTVSDGEQLIPILTEKFEHNQINEWFSTSYKTINEVSILYNNMEYRPDKIVVKEDELHVIDYKFGEENETSHKKQLSNYVSVLSKMSKRPVKGYLWYVSIDKIVEL